MLEDIDRNIDFQTMFLMWFEKSIKFPIEWYVTWYTLRKFFYIYIVRSGSSESGEIKGFRQTFLGGHVSILFKY